MTGNETQARRLAETLARASYGRLLAIVAARSGDVMAAEDALSDAFAKALSHWPENGVPDNPEAWLVVTARRRIGHQRRHQDVRDRSERTLEMLYHYTQSTDPSDLPDERLKLLFVCAHPAIAPAIRTPLMLQTVLGLDAERIGQAFLVPGPTIGQRLVRAKTKIRDAGVPFTVPERAELPERLQDVLNAIYAAFNTGWDDMPTTVDGKEDLAQEAIYLARLVVELLPGEAEALGLLALMLHSEARRNARRAPDGRFVPLSEQDPALWSRDMIEAAERYLMEAAHLRNPGRYQTEAAIQSVHAGRLFDRQVDPLVLVRLHEILVRQTSSMGAAVSLAAARLAAGELQAADQQLADLAEDTILHYQPYWVVRARLLARLDQLNSATDAFERAIALTRDPTVSAFLAAEQSRLLIQ